MTRERDRIQENANKYIVKNCPAILPMTKLCDSESTFNCGTFCRDCTDCVIKQVIEKCKEVETIENVKTLYDAAQSGMFLQANKILKLLDIQEE